MPTITISDEELWKKAKARFPGAKLTGDMPKAKTGKGSKRQPGIKTKMTGGEKIALIIWFALLFYVLIAYLSKS
jgi:hypothetical protein